MKSPCALFCAPCSFACVLFLVTLNLMLIGYGDGETTVLEGSKKLPAPASGTSSDGTGRGPATFPPKESDGNNTDSAVTEESLSAYELRRQELLEHPDNLSENDLKHLRETHINVLHEAIDAKLIDQSFIRTLGSVSNPPKVHDATRDTLTIRSIEEDLNFTLGERVVRWKTMSAKNVDRHVVVGLTEGSLVVLLEQEGQYSVAEELVLEATPITLEVLTLWDTQMTSAVGCVVISMGNFLVWYTMREEQKYRLVEEWRWPLHKTITQIKFFGQKEVDALLLIGRHPNRPESVSATVYEFAFNERQFWLMQKMGLEHPCASVGLVPAGDEYLVAFPQNSTVLLYTFRVGDQNRRKFKPVGNYSSEALRSVDAFQIGRYSYIAISGKSPAVLRYKRGRFYAQKIPTESLEIVEAFFEIPARTFRDDMILLVQHRMIFATHEIQRLEALVWNGVSFDLATNIPCMVQNEVIDHEVSCMLDVDRNDGLFGGTIVQRGKSISIIVPRHQAHSSLYHLSIELLSGEHPVLMKIQEMKETMEAFTKIIDYQNAVIEQAQSYVALMDTDPVLLKRQNLTRLETPLLEFVDDYDFSATSITIGHNTWREADFQIDLGATVKLVQDIELSVDAMLSELKHSVRRDARSHDQLFNGTLQVQGKLYIDGALSADDMYIQRFEEDTRTRFTRNVSHDEPIEELYVKDLAVVQLYFDYFNGIPANDLAFDVDGRVELSGELVIGGDLYVNSLILPDGGTVNGIDLSESLVYFNNKNRRWKNVTLDSLEVIDDVHVAKELNGAQIDLHEAEKTLRNAIDEQGQVLRTKTLHVEGDLSFQRINGIPWKTFLDGLVFKNRPMRLSHLHVEGNVTFESEPNVQFLNRLRFPEDYVLKQGPRETIITGQKYFHGPLTMDALDIDGFVNNINPFDFITLHDEQYIPGNVTFDSLEIEDSLDVRGAVRGKQMEKFLDNPTLKQTKVLEAACEFDEVVVNGPIYVDWLDGYELERFLEDVVYLDQPFVEINASKHYRQLQFEEPIRVESNMLGEIHLEDLLTKSTDQTLNITMIVGSVFFNRVQTDGLFGGINVTEWDTNSIKIFGDQHTGATLEFCPEYSLLYANNLEIVGTLNGVPRSEFFDMDEEIVFKDQVVHLSDMYANYLTLEHSTIDGPSNTINDVHLPTFDATRFSLSQRQTFKEDVFIETLYVSHSFVTNFLNGFDLKLLRENVEAYLDDDQMLSGNHVIESLQIDGDVEIGMLNGVDFRKFLENVIWLDRPNAVSGALHFQKPLTVQGDLKIEGTLNEIPFNDFLANVVYKTDYTDVVEITGPKLFTKGFDVRGDLNTPIVNNIPLKDFILKNESIVFPGSVVSGGRIYVKELVVSKTINGKSFKPIEAYYAYNNATDTHIIQGDLYLGGLQMVHNLEALGGWNELLNVSHKLSSLIRTNQDYSFKGHYVFQNELHFKHGFTTDFINGYNISNVHNEIVYYDQAEPIVFSEPVEFYGNVWGLAVQVEGNLVGKNVMGIDPDALSKDVLLVNKDYEIADTMVFLPGTFKCDHLTATFINNQPLKDLITLHTEQTIDRPVYVKQIIVHNPVAVEGLVNGRDLRLERQNTVMRYGEQWIEAPSVFNSIRVLNKMTLPKVLNGAPFGEPVVLGHDMTITSPISFYQISADEVYTEDTIGGVNFDNWHDQTLWADGRVDQEYYGKFRSRKVTFRDSILGNGTINGMTIQEIARHLHAEKRLVENELAKRRAAYRAVCQETQNIINGTQRRMYFFNYFVQRQTIREPRPIQSFWTFEQHANHFLAVNFGCESKFYQWNPQDRVFVELFQAQTGYVFEWRTISSDDDTVRLVTRSAPTEEQCNVNGLSIWQFKGLSLELVKNWPAMDVDSVFVDALYPDRFYVLDRTNVSEYNTLGEVTDQWDLSRIFETASFLPTSLGIELALSDGKRIAVLSRKESEPKIRRKRSNEEPLVNLALFSSQMNMQNYMQRNYSYYRTDEDPSVDHPLLTQPDPLNEIGSVQESNDTVIQTNEPTPDLPEPPPVDRQQVEPRIAKEVPLGRISTTENHHFPDPAAGEVLSFHVGFHGEPKQHLVAVTEAVQAVIKGNHDAVRIYSDIVQGHLYQIIACNQPTQLTVLEIRDETILAFLEQRQKVQLYTYRGRKGFVHWNSFNLASPGVQMRSLQLPQTPFFKCKLHYLAIALSGQELMFLKAKTQGDCGFRLQLDCGSV